MGLLLDKHGIDVNQSAEYGVTPLHAAAKHGHADVVKQLLARKGIELNKRDESGRTPLFIAIQEGNLEIVNLLLNQNGIDVMLGDNMGQTPLHPLHLAAVNNLRHHVEIVTQ